MPTPVGTTWPSPSLRRARFEANIRSLESRDPALAQRLWHHVPASEAILDRVDQPMPATSVQQIVSKLYPDGNCAEPILVAGIAMGCLWEALYSLPTYVSRTPGYRPPLYFLTSEIERLWVVLHLRDWQKMMCDARVRLYVGQDCTTQFQVELGEQSDLKEPKLSIAIEPDVWPVGVSLESVLASASDVITSKYHALQQDLASAYAATTPEIFAQRFAGNTLRVLGLVSRYTTFLQHSMRDWLCAFDKLGHTTQLKVERDDYALDNSVTFAQAVADYKPDLILLIDHARSGFNGLPANVPCVMWIQDRLGNIFNAKTGASQNAMDYVIGYGRGECVYEFGYPSQRFLPAVVPTNEERFAPRTLANDEINRYSCDVSFVSHASMPAEEIVKAEIDKQSSPYAKQLLQLVFDRLRALYDAGGSVTRPIELLAFIRAALADSRTAVGDERPILDLFAQRINNALFRHQTIGWLDDLGVNLHLYGKGWEQHPRFAKYARGVADNQHELCAIHLASKINLQVSPFGSAHQRVFDGIASGGFFLLRACPGDVDDQLYQRLWCWCDERGIESDIDLHASADDEARSILALIQQRTSENPFHLGYDFVRELHVAAMDGFARNAATLWPQYADVAFNSREQLHALVKRFLNSDIERQQITRAMRDIVLQRHTYTHVARRTIEFIKQDLFARTSPIAIAA